MATESFQSSGSALYTSTTLSKQYGTVMTIPVASTYVDKSLKIEINAPSASVSYAGGLISFGSYGVGQDRVSYFRPATHGPRIHNTFTCYRSAMTRTNTSGWISEKTDLWVFPSEEYSEVNLPWIGISGVTLSADEAFSVAVPLGSSTATCNFSTDTSGGVEFTGFPVLTVSELRTMLSLNSGNRGSVALIAGDAFDVTVPNGSSSTVTFHFTVDASGNTTVN